MKSFNEIIGNTINERRQSLAEQIVARQYEQQPEFWLPFGVGGRKVSIRDASYHLGYLAEAILAADVSLFTGYIAWLKELFAGLHFPDDAMIKTLECIGQVLTGVLPKKMAIIVNEYIAAGLEQMQQPAPVTGSFIYEHDPLADLSMKYVNTLLRGDRNHAIRLIMNAVDRGINVKDIYLRVFQPSLYEFGRLWLQNKINVAQEHYCSAVTQMIMSQLYPHIFNPNRIGRRLVAACVEGELHQIGIHMVADFFEMEGWDTYYLGANTPTKAILQAIHDFEADILGISITMHVQRSTLEDLLNHLRQSEIGKKIKILVGGYIFQKTPDLYKRLEADGWAADAQEAVNEANRLLDIKTWDQKFARKGVRKGE
jgi:methanogenic corrinoid protein MtbC1